MIESTIREDATPPTVTAPPSWRDAVVYQVYLRSFRDGNGDGIGDFAGLRDGLGEIAGLGCDAIWLNPCYVSPQRDHGYDIADYFAVDPSYGTLADFDAMLQRAHELGLRVLMDMVANHCSSEHEWFRAAVAAGPGSPARERFIFRDGRGESGELPPGNWESVFGGSAWTRVVEPDGALGQWYLHSFDPGQPDFNWRNPQVDDYFERVLRFWFDRGVDGFRIDVAHGHVKAADLPDHRGLIDGSGEYNHGMWDQPEVHDIYRAWRAIGDEYEPPRFFIGEVWVPSPERVADYLRPDELHNVFSFDLLVQPWIASKVKAAVHAGLSIAGGSPAWTLSNHDVHRVVTRYGQEQPDGSVIPTDMIAAARRRGTVDLQRGDRRARAAAGFVLALPGSVYLYQGEELGLPEVFDLPNDSRQDPIWLRSGGAELGRDGCRVPLPWEADGDSFGFSDQGSSSLWLPQPTWFGNYARETQARDPDSMLSLYRSLLRARRQTFAGSGPLEWLSTGNDSVLAFRRGEVVCVVNFGAGSYSVPLDWGAHRALISTQPLDGGRELPPDTTAWLAID